MYLKSQTAGLKAGFLCPTIPVPADAPVVEGRDLFSLQLITYQHFFLCLIQTCKVHWLPKRLDLNNFDIKGRIISSEHCYRAEFIIYRGRICVCALTTIEWAYIRKEGLTRPIRWVQWPVRCCITLISAVLRPTTAWGDGEKVDCVLVVAHSHRCPPAKGPLHPCPQLPHVKSF